MAQLQINSNNTFTIDVTVRESDRYTESIFVHFERNMIREEIQESNQMYFTPVQLEQLGKFFVSQADEIRKAQALRHLTERIHKDPRQG